MGEAWQERKGCPSRSESGLFIKGQELVCSVCLVAMNALLPLLLIHCCHCCYN
jgi:hypothetical protein